MNITHKVCQHLPNNNNLFGWIYLITNPLNGKVYVGKVEFPNTVEDRWEDHLSQGNTLRKKRKANPHKNFQIKKNQYIPKLNKTTQKKF